MNILWLKTELLHPVDKGGKIRTYNMLKELKRDHRITYLTLDDNSAGPSERSAAEEYCDELVSVAHKHREKFSPGFYSDLLLNLKSRLPYAIKKYESRQMRKEIVERGRTGRFDVVVCDFLAPAVNIDFNLGCRTILFQHNVETMIWKRHYEVQNNRFKKTYLYGQWLKMRAFERTMCRRFDSVIAVSADDRRHIREEYGVESVFDVPTGVDTNFFQPTGAEKEEPHNLVFTGSMDWLPNEDAIHYFTEEIFPRVKQQLPDATLTVVGRDPYPGLLELAKKDPSIVVTGRVDDVRPYMERAGAYVVPLRIGGGTRLKIFEAMAMEKAIVSTTIGAEGLQVKDGKELLLADTPESFAASVVTVLTNKSEALSLGRNAAATVRANFGWKIVAERFAKICEDSVREPRRVAATPTWKKSAESAG